MAGGTGVPPVGRDHHPPEIPRLGVAHAPDWSGSLRLGRVGPHPSCPKKRQNARGAAVNLRITAISMARYDNGSSPRGRDGRSAWLQPCRVIAPPAELKLRTAPLATQATNRCFRI